MQYDNHEDETQEDILGNLAAISADKPSFPSKTADSVWDEDDTWMATSASNARIDIEVECWGRRLA